MTDETRSCPSCHGTGHVQKTRTEVDNAMSIALGNTFDMGFIPYTREVTEEVDCPSCHGTGTER